MMNRFERRSEKYRAAQSERQRQKNRLMTAVRTDHVHAMANSWQDGTWKAVINPNGTVITGGTGGVTFYPNTAPSGTTTPYTTFYPAPASPAAMSEYDVERIALKVIELLATQPEGDIDAALKKWRKEHIG